MSKPNTLALASMADKGENLEFHSLRTREKLWEALLHGDTSCSPQTTTRKARAQARGGPQGGESKEGQILLP